MLLDSTSTPFNTVKPATKKDPMSEWKMQVNFSRELNLTHGKIHTHEKCMVHTIYEFLTRIFQAHTLRLDGTNAKLKIKRSIDDSWAEKGVQIGWTTFFWFVWEDVDWDAGASSKDLKNLLCDPKERKSRRDSSISYFSRCSCQLKL